MLSFKNKQTEKLCCSQCLSFLSSENFELHTALAKSQHLLVFDNSAETLGIEWNPALRQSVNKANSLLWPFYSGLNKSLVSHLPSSKPLSYAQIWGARW